MSTEETNPSVEPTEEDEKRWATPFGERPDSDGNEEEADQVDLDDLIERESEGTDPDDL